MTEPVGVRVEGAERIRKILDEQGDRIRPAVSKALLRAALHLESVVRETVRDTFPRGRTGALPRSFKASLVEEGGRIQSSGVFSDLVYAGILDRGGTIHPKSVENLAVPLKKIPVGKWPRTFPKDALVLITSRRKNKLLVDAERLRRGKIDPVFVLKKQVTIRGRRYLDAAEAKSRPRVLEILNDELDDALEKAGDDA